MIEKEAATVAASFLLVWITVQNLREYISKKEATFM